MGNKQVNVRLSEDARSMLAKMSQRHHTSEAATITKALYLMWLVTGGGKHDVDMSQTEYVLSQTGTLE